MEETILKLRILAKAETTLMKANARRAAMRARLFAMAIGLLLLTVVMVNGAALTSSAGLPIAHNSADINADGLVNLSDVQLFAADFYDVSYNFRSDLAFDAVVNLSDIVPLAQAFGGACP